MPWAAAAAAAVGLGGGIMQSDASKGAAQTQANASNNATNAQLSMFNTLNQQSAPYRTAGQGGLTKLSQLLGIGQPAGSAPSTSYTGQTPLTRAQFDSQAYLDAYPDVQKNTLYNTDPYQHYITEGQGTGSYRPAFQLSTAPPPTDGTGGSAGGDASQGGFGSLLHQFNANDLNSNLAPNYQFQLQQGLGATQNMLNSTGGLISGNSLRGINDYAQGTAAGAYQQAFQNYTANQTNIFNRLSSIAGLGQTANATTANAGSSISGNAAQSQMNAGASQAAGQIGSAKALTGGLNNAASWYTLGNMMNSGSGSSGGGGLDTFSLNNP